MGLETISESAFLVTELRYTLSQLHVQALDLDNEARKGATFEGKCINDTLDEMVQYEKEYQGKYADLLHAQTSSGTAEAEAVPLPVSGAEEAEGTETEFEKLRARTISMLEQAGQEWPQPLLDLVKEHVTRDRRATTHIAECRKSYLASEQRPDLEEPLTTHAEPHVLGDETVASEPSAASTPPPQPAS